MAKGFHHKKSKRMGLKMKHKIIRKGKEQRRKLRREYRRMKAQGIVRKRRHKIAIPNLFPYKKQLIEKLERKKLAQDAENKARIAQLKQKKRDMKNSQKSLEKFHRRIQEERKQQEIVGIKPQKKSPQSYFKELNRVCDLSDIILEVIDARDPMSCRCKELEAKIQGMPGEKKIILVLNKIDLVPEKITKLWLNYLRREYATILFKASRQKQRQHISSNTLFKKSVNKQIATDMLSSSKAVGAANLLEIIKKYALVNGYRKNVTVGVIGYPNVGKSSIINSLKKSKAAAVSSVPGFTKNIQEIQLDHQVRLLDSPGVVMGKDQEDILVLKNIIKVNDVVDPMGPMDLILKKINKDDILKLYRIADYDNSHEFLCNVAMSRGKLKKGGIPDLEQAAKMVLQDWVSGKIKYYTLPPNYKQEKQEMIIEN